MAFGISRKELMEWKDSVRNGNISFLTHYWIHPKYPEITTVTKVGCSDLAKLVEWGHHHGLKKEWIHNRSEFPHFDLIGEIQKEILAKEGLNDHLVRFKISNGKE